MLLKQVNAEPEHSISQLYISKLLKSFDLILNDLPDNRDDTINSKLLDSIQLLLKNSTKLSETIRDYLQTKIFHDSQNLNEKDSDVAHFYLNLTKISIQASKSDSYNQKVLNFISLFLNQNFNLNDFQIESSVFCSLLGLLDELYTQSINEHSYTLILELLFSPESLLVFLDPDCKSIYVRKSFKSLLIKHLISSIESNKNIDSFISILSTMPIELKSSNLDIQFEIFKHFLFFFDQDRPDLVLKLKDIHSILGLNEAITDLVTEGSVEYFSYLIGIGLLFKVEGNFYDECLKCLIKICKHFASIKSDEKLKSQKKSSDLLFKFQIYFYSFLTDLSAEEGLLKHLIDDSIKHDVERLKEKVCESITLPLRLKFNNHQDTDEDNYLLLINNESFELKCLILKQCFYNLKLFLRKFNPFENLSSQLSKNQTLYLLRHLNLDMGLKNLLLNFLNDYFMLKQEQAPGLNTIDLEYLKQMAIELINSFGLKLNDTFNELIFKLISVGFKNLGNQKFLDCSEPIFKHLDILMNKKNSGDLAGNGTIEVFGKSGLDHGVSYSREFLADFELLIKFLANVCKNSVLPIEVLNEKYFFVLKKSIYFLLLNQDFENDLKDTILDFFQNLFQTISNQVTPPAFVSIFSDETMFLIEKACLGETEAFMRREFVKFIGIFSIFKFKNLLVGKNSTPIDFYGSENRSLWNKCSYFSYLLLNEHDWQSQLHCLTYFKSMFSLMSNVVQDDNQLLTSVPTGVELSSELNKEFERFSLLETVFCLSDCLKSLFACLSDYDQYVVAEACQMIIDLKNNEGFMQILTDLDKKSRNGSYSKEIKCSYVKNMKLELVKSGSCIAVGQEDSDEAEFQVGHENYLNKLFYSASLDDLHARLQESKTTSDIYTRNPISILDDIISSYQFDLDDEKAVDCY